MTTSTIKIERKIALPTRYPLLTMTSALSQVMVSVSPPVSPRVVARILMIQKPSVTAGTLLATCSNPLGISPPKGIPAHRCSAARNRSIAAAEMGEVVQFNVGQVFQPYTDLYPTLVGLADLPCNIPCQKFRRRPKSNNSGVRYGSTSTPFGTLPPDARYIGSR